MYNIYPTLLDSFQWYKNSVDYKDKADAKEELLNRINRVPEVPSPHMEEGKAFKSLLDKATYDFEGAGVLRERNLWSESGFIFTATLMNEFIKKLAFSVKEYFTEAVINVDGVPVRLYGYVDNIKENVIYDVKFVKSYEVAKYFSSAQRLVYPYCINTGEGAQCSHFEFLATDGERYFFEQYTLNEKKDTAMLKNILRDFIDFIEKNRTFITDEKIFGSSLVLPNS